MHFFGTFGVSTLAALVVDCFTGTIVVKFWKRRDEMKGSKGYKTHTKADIEQLRRRARIK